MEINSADKFNRVQHQLEPTFQGIFFLIFKALKEYFYLKTYKKNILKNQGITKLVMHRISKYPHPQMWILNFDTCGCGWSRFPYNTFFPIFFSIIYFSNLFYFLLWWWIPLTLMPIRRKGIRGRGKKRRENRGCVSCYNFMCLMFLHDYILRELLHRLECSGEILIP